MAQGMLFYALKAELASNRLSSDDTNAFCFTGGPFDLARSIIDHEITRLEESIRAMKTRRNELSPISCLPPEIMCTIFSFIKSDPLLPTSHCQSWVSFSQVSRHWRSLALSAPELWTNIPLYNSRWAQEMLTRSKMANLTIQVDLTTNVKPIETIRSCLSHMKRLEEIDISGASGSTLENLFRGLPKSAPQLHTLRIGSLPKPPSSFSFSSRTTFTIQEDFICDTERLQCIDLINCEISWDSRLFTGLTHLTLHRSLKDDANSSISQFLHALQRMPALTNLDLEESIPHDSGIPSPYPTVDLPCLRVLRILSDIDPLTIALRYITFPSSAVLKLICRQGRSSQLDFSNFCSVLATKFLSSLTIQSLGLQDYDVVTEHGLQFLVWTTAVFLGYMSSLSPQLDLALIWPSASSQLPKYTKALTSAFNAMNLSVLTQLQLFSSNRIDSKTLLKTFGKLPRLERVHVKDSATPLLLEALVFKAKAADKSKTAYCSVSFPELCYIHLDGTDFADTNMGSISVDTLMVCLMERCERKAAVHELHLDNCYSIEDSDIAKLEEIVVDVIWDRIEQGHSTEYGSEEEREYDSDGNTIEDYDYDYDDFFSGGYGRRNHFLF